MSYETCTNHHPTVASLSNYYVVYDETLRNTLHYPIKSLDPSDLAKPLRLCLIGENDVIENRQSQ